MSTTLQIPQAYQRGFTLSGWLENPAWIGRDDLSGFTAKASLLMMPSLTATVGEAAASIDLASFNPINGRVRVSLALSSLATPVPVGSYRVRWIVTDPNGVPVAGPTPKFEQTRYDFTP